MGEPYCKSLREKIISVAEEISLHVIPNGTVAVIQGPRFSTSAESRWFSANGWDIVNMTQYPECYFAKELGLCYSAIAAVTDYDVGLHESLIIDPKHMGAVLEIFKDNIQKMKSLLLAFIGKSVPNLSCGCASSMLEAYCEKLL